MLGIPWIKCGNVVFNPSTIRMIDMRGEGRTLVSIVDGPDGKTREVQLVGLEDLEMRNCFREPNALDMLEAHPGKQ